MEQIALACDHGGFLLKEDVKTYLESKGYQVIDFGTNSTESCNYPEFAKKAAEFVAEHEGSKGIVICTTGEGVMMTANKVKGIRCGLVYNDDVASLIVRHNKANMMSMGAKYTTKEQAQRYIDIFLSSEFEGGRHQIRVDMIEG